MTNSLVNECTLNRQQWGNSRAQEFQLILLARKMNIENQKKIVILCGAWWLVLVIPGLDRLGHEDYSKSEASQGYALSFRLDCARVRPCFKHSPTSQNKIFHFNFSKRLIRVYFSDDENFIARVLPVMTLRKSKNMNLALHSFSAKSL